MKMKLRSFLVLGLAVLMAVLPILPNLSVYAAGDPEFTIAEEILPLNYNETWTLDVKYNNTDTSNYMTWTSSDNSIATVSAGTIQAQAKTGEITITAKFDDGYKSQTQTVTVRVFPTCNKAWMKEKGVWYLRQGKEFLTNWQKVGDFWYFMGMYGEMQVGWHTMSSGTYYLFPSTGIMAIGWQLIDGDWYFFSDSGALWKGWLWKGNHWYYLDPANDGAMITGSKIINGHGYYFDPSSGAMWIGWLENGGNWFFYTDSGAAAIGWLLRGNTWYYMDPTFYQMKTGWLSYKGYDYYLDPVSGAMATGWKYIDGAWYYFSPSGAKCTGWIEVKGVWYYMDPSSGKMKTGWIKPASCWYYMDPSSGAMCLGWQKISGDWYYFSNSGAMCTGWIPVKGSWYLMGDDGVMVTGWHFENGAYYYLQDSGKMATETVYIGSKQEVFQTNGKWINTNDMDSKAQGYNSSTSYLILVDLNKRVTKVYKGSYGNWKVEQAYLCTVGDTSKGWDTTTGDFYVGYSAWGNPITRGYSFDDSDGHTLYYWTRFNDAYLFHSILYDGGTYNESVYGNALGEALSHGCVRMRIQNAKWIYDNVPDKSRVIVY
ncbi:MAG: L,D-transpeptidase family protein [Parasporobacterium sp.]|nr:L,D-transpeptidase family protein [Parasporobacterium sp.]